MRGAVREPGAGRHARLNRSLTGRNRRLADRALRCEEDEAATPGLGVLLVLLGQELDRELAHLTRQGDNVTLLSHELGRHILEERAEEILELFFDVEACREPV